MGLHRSGTSILYQMLGKAGHLNTVTAYHILKYDELLHNHINNLEDNIKNVINKLFKEKGITDRIIDYIPVTADYNHEYVYLFSEKDQPLKICFKNRWLFENLCKKITYISGNNNPILLKNPYDYSNFLFIKKIYPNARFIFIHRNPLYVLSSLMRTMQMLLKHKNEYTAIFSKKYRQIFKNPLALLAARIYYTSKIPIGLFVEIQSYAWATSYFLKNINQLPKNDYILIKYEDLCRDPNKVIAEIISFLQIKSDVDFSMFIKPRKLDLIPEVKILKKYIFKKMKPFFEYFDYSI